MKENKTINIFIKGKKNYINNVNENIKSWVKNCKNINIIDCYDIEEIKDDIDKIMKEYKLVLKVEGEQEINKL